MTTKKQIKFYATPDEQAWVDANGGPTAALSTLIRDAIAKDTAARAEPDLAAAVRDLAVMVERLASGGWLTTLVPATPAPPADEDDAEKLKNAFSLF